jgi:hypothetical protein
MSIALDQGTKDAKPRQCPGLVIRVRNLSDHTIYLNRPLDPLVVLSFDIRSPSGRNLSPKQHEFTHGSRQATRLKPNEIFDYRPIDLRSLCDVSEPGTYTILLKQKVLLDPGLIEVTSNPLAIALPVRAFDSPAIQWGPLTNGVQVSIVLHESGKQAKPGQSFAFVIRIRNLSDRIVYLPRTPDPLVFRSFDIRSPSGHNLSPKPHEYNRGARWAEGVKPNEVFQYPPLDMGALCDLSEPGAYTILVKQKVLRDPGPLEVTSNCLTVNVPAQAEQKPPSGTNQSSIPGF